MQIVAKDFLQGYSKTVMLCVLERANRHISKARMMKMTGATQVSLNNFEELKVVNLPLLEEYLNILDNIKVVINIRKDEQH